MFKKEEKKYKISFAHAKELGCLCAVTVSLFLIAPTHIGEAKKGSSGSLKTEESLLILKEEIENRKIEILAMNEIKENEVDYKEVPMCSNSPTKSYMDGWMITNTNTAQYKLLSSDEVYVNDRGHFSMMYKDVEYIGVALARYFGDVGDKFKITLEDGKEMNVFKLDEKKQKELVDGICMHPDGSFIEMVIDESIAFDYYGGSNGYVLNGNFNNHESFRGEVVKVEKVIE